MLAVHQLKSALKTGNRSPQFSSLLDLILRYGSLSEVGMLLRLFLEYPYAELLPPIMYLGDEVIADDLYNHVIENKQLKVGYPPDTLLALSYMEHPETEAILVKYYRQAFTLNWAMHEAVCKALLNYPCAGYRKEILKVVEQCLDKVLFPDFIPSPAIKTQSQELAARLSDHAQYKATPGCSGGILLALALYGPQYRDDFTSAIQYPGWASPFYQNNEEFISMGMHYLKISLKELYSELILHLQYQKQYTHENIYGFVKLLKHKLREPYFYPVRCIQKQDESLSFIYNHVFKPAFEEMSIFEYLVRYIKSKDKALEYIQSFEEIMRLYENQILQEKLLN